MEMLASGQQLERELHFGSELFEVQVLHDEIGSKLFGLDNVYIV